MSFTTDQTQTQINTAVGAFLLLHSSNQAIIEADVAENDSAWYPIIMNELGAAENLVVQWRQNGFLYFKQQVLQAIMSAGQAFLNAQQPIDTLFQQLQNNFSSTTRQQIVDQLNQLSSPIQSLNDSINSYLTQLKNFQVNMETPLNNMEKTAAQVQSQAADIQSEIEQINAHIADLKQQIITDRKAIAEAKKKRDEGIGETIFGIIFAPFTGGLSLILAGIGVASIAEGEEKINQLESTISNYQSEISNDQSHLQQDQRQIATLKSLNMSLEIAIQDMNYTQTALDSLRTTWSFLNGELSTAAQKVANSNTAQEAIMQKVWFDAAINVWSEIVPFCQQLTNNNAPQPKRVTIG